MALVYHGLYESRHKETAGECLELVLNQMHRLDLQQRRLYYHIIALIATQPPTPRLISCVINIAKDKIKNIAQEQGQSSSQKLKMKFLGSKSFRW